MSDKFKSPMLAEDANLETITWPRRASQKLDGIRAVVVNGQVFSRNGKLIPNLHTQKLFGREALNGLDGELIVGSPRGEGVFSRAQSGLRSKDGEPDVAFYVFDHYDLPNFEYQDRIEAVMAQVAGVFNEYPDLIDKIRVHLSMFIGSSYGLTNFEEQVLEQGFEGVMLRPASGDRYKYGRSTTKEGLLLKVKRYVHEEAKIVGYAPEMENINEAKRDELGRLKRSQAKDGLVPTNRLGAYIVESPEWPKRFNVSCGSMTREEKTERFRLINLDMGRTLRFKYLKVGVVESPRHPLFDGFREAFDDPSLAAESVAVEK